MNQLSARELNRATLARQLLLERRALPAPQAVAQVVALQAQEPASPYLALWNRIISFDPAALDTAFSAGEVVKSNAVRMTLHAVHRSDYRVFREATEPTIRSARLHDQRYKVTGLTPEDADALLPELLAYTAQPRPAAQLRAWLDARQGAEPHPGVWWALRQYAPLLHVPTGEAWGFGQRPTYRAAPDLPVLANPEVADTSLQALVRRYLSGFGPASVADVAQFGMVPRARARAALLALGDELVQFRGPGGETLYDLPGATLPDPATPALPRLLGMWDNILLAYADRSRVIPPEYRRVVIRINGDVLPTLLVDGYVAGVWRAVDDAIEARAFHPLPEDVWGHLAREAADLLGLLTTRDRQVYSRYNHWWAKLPPGETRPLRS